MMQNSCAQKNTVANMKNYEDYALICKQNPHVAYNTWNNR